MVDYSAQNVAQLKELLKGRGLSLDGKKADLVSRLQEADASAASAGSPAAANAASQAEASAAVDAKESDDLLAAEGVDEPATKEQSNGTEASKEAKDESSTKAQDAAETEPAKEEEPIKVYTPEERKQKAVEFLETKIRRALKFGDEAAAAESRRVLARVEKFGVELGTTLAVEIGLEKAMPQNEKNGKRPFGRKSNGNRNKRSKRN